MPCYQFDGITPVVHPESFVHPCAVLIGDVRVGKNVFIGPNASLRGDCGALIIGDGANIQDNCVLHCFPGQQTIVEANGHIGHSAILHGCYIKTNALIGMNAVIMDGAVIGENSLVGALAFIKANSQFAADSLIIGNPAKVIRPLTEQEIAWKTSGTLYYQRLAARYQNSLREVDPLTRLPPAPPTRPLDDPLLPKYQL